jgi:hypothetical protein
MKTFPVGTGDFNVKFAVSQIFIIHLSATKSVVVLFQLFQYVASTQATYTSAELVYH